MHISLIQAPLFWENPQSNRNYFEKKINDLGFKTDLIVLPEMFTSGFTMHPQSVAEPMVGETTQWLQNLASKNQLAITGSLVIAENGNYYNRMVFVYPNGQIASYNKRHLFTLAGEDQVYNPGSSKTIVSYKDWNICLQICYDLRFPVFARNVENYDLLIYVANWPKPRINAWDILLKARAVENLCYVVGVNRIGEDGNQHQYVGHSQAIDELGNLIVEPSENEGIFTAILDKNKMLETRSKLNFLNDQDAFQLI